MGYETVLVEKEGHVGVIALNRPEKLNTFNVPLGRDLNAALEEMEQDRDIYVVILRGNGRVFSAGIDITDFPKKSIMAYRSWITLMEKMTLTIAEMRKPVIAAVHGVAVANGAGLVAAADLAVATEGARFGLTAIDVGLFCMGPAVPMDRCVGKKHCLELLLTGDLIDAPRAERIGLVNKVVPEDKLMDAALALANKLAAKSPLALQMGKESYYTMADMPLEKALRYSNEMFSELCTLKDAEEGVRAFLEKRPPKWRLE
jgi:enoyl-CoA hydratase/carnithine racemase